jgi:excisionase family DNA binding protein
MGTMDALGLWLGANGLGSIALRHRGIRRSCTAGGLCRPAPAALLCGVTAADRKKEAAGPPAEAERSSGLRMSGRQDLNLRPLGPERPRGVSHDVTQGATDSHPVDLVGGAPAAGSHREAPIAYETTPFGAPVARLGRGTDAWIGPAEVAARLKVSRATVYGLVKSGVLQSRRVGLQIRIPISALEAFLAGGGRLTPAWDRSARRPRTP